MMVEIDDTIVSEDILTQHFACDISKCKGICCVEGNAGAPLEEEEVELLERYYPLYKKYISAEGVTAIEQQGFMVLDEDGDLTTPLVNDAECAYAYTDGGVTLCGVEKGWLEGLYDFRKPISCHLYPIRVVKFRSGGVGLNYHRWSVCKSACRSGEKRGIRIYESLREPLIRRFGEEYYGAMEAAAEMLNRE